MNFGNERFLLSYDTSAKAPQNKLRGVFSYKLFEPLYYFAGQEKGMLLQKYPARISRKFIPAKKKNFAGKLLQESRKKILWSPAFSGRLSLENDGNHLNNHENDKKAEDENERKSR